MKRDLRYRELISLIAIMFILLPFALCLVSSGQAETIKFNFRKEGENV